MNPYSAIAEIYDDFRGESPNMWAAYLDELFGIYGEKKPRRILDLGCGTGSVSRGLARLGYSVTASDISEDMLAVAASRGGGVFYIRQDMRETRLATPAEGAVCCLDAINYLPDSDDLYRTFSALAENMTPGGLFIFDVNTKHRFESKYGNNSFILESKKGLVAWNCEYHPRLKRCDFFLSYFKQDKDGRYDRYDEEQSEYIHSDEDIRRTAEAAGFRVLACLGRLSLDAPAMDAEKIHYILKLEK